MAELEGDSKRYAVKEMKKHLLVMKGAVDNVFNEKQLMLLINHPFLVTMDYMFEDDYRLYFVMPYIQGTTLWKYRCQKKQLPLNQVQFIAAQVVMALGHLHEKGFMHRDLKTENILIREDGYVTLIDYGLAVDLTEQSQEFRD